MYQAIEIANYFLDKGKENEVSISPMKLLKLVYLAHGWYLATQDEPLIQDEIQAWQYGPVIPNLYHKVKHIGNSPIQEKLQTLLITKAEPKYVTPEVKDDKVKGVLDIAWDIYSDSTAIQLSNLTHQENTPWYKVYHKKGALRSVSISNELIKEHFDLLLENA